MNTRYLRLAHQHTTGVALSDTALRFVKFTQEGEMAVPDHAGELKVPEGTIENGRIVNKAKFINFLKVARKIHRFDTINLVLISPLVQTFSISVKGAAPLYIKEAVEKMFGQPAKNVLYEFHAIGSDGSITTFQVSTILKAVSQEFLNCFKAAGLNVTSLDSVGHSLSRSILPIASHGCAMVVSIDSDVTTVVIAVNGKVSQTTMFAFGDDSFTEAIMKGLKVGPDKARVLKLEQGLIGDNSKAVFQALDEDCVALVHHINEEYINWHTMHKGLPPLEHIYLTGKGSILKGLDEYISVGLRLPVDIANVWANCLSFDEYVPNLPLEQAVNFAPAIGAALVSGDMANLLPIDHKQALQRKHIMGLGAKIAISFILGVAVGFAVARIVEMPAVHAQMLAVLHKIQARW